MAAEDPDLRRRVRTGDPIAVEIAVDTYLPQILRAARGAGLDTSDAEDVTQATFTVFLESLGRFEGRSSVRTWLFGILYKKIAESRRGRARDRLTDALDPDFEDRFDAAGRWRAPPRPLDVDLHHKEVEQAIFGCLAAAPLRPTLAFLLREVEGHSAEDVCNVLGVTRTHLRVLLHRIRERVRGCLESMGITR